MEGAPRTAVVTGAGSGIGQATAALFARAGYHVLCADIVVDAARAVARDLSAEGLHAQAHCADVSDLEATDAMIAHAVDWTGRLDVTVANAGLMEEGDALSVSLEQWNRVMAVNATGAFLTARSALPPPSISIPTTPMPMRVSPIAIPISTCSGRRTKRT